VPTVEGMTHRMAARLLDRLSLSSPRSDIGRRWRPRPAAEALRAIESPRRVWLFGPELRPKTVPLRRLR